MYTSWKMLFSKLCFSVGLSGSPLSSDYAILKWTDTSSSALNSIKYIGFTNGARQHSIDYGANCVLLKTHYGVNPAYYTQNYNPSPYQSSPYQSPPPYQSSPPYQSPYPYNTKTAQVKDWLLQMFFTDLYSRHKQTHTQHMHDNSSLYKILTAKYPTRNFLNMQFGEKLSDARHAL